MNNENKPAISDKRLATLYQYWQSKQGDRLMPARADIDPTEIPKLLPILLLIDVIATVSYRYRLVGTEIVSSAGQDITGKLFDEVLPDDAYKKYLLGLVNEVVESRQPLYAEGAFMAEKRVERLVRRLVLPLSSDGTTVDMILAGQTFMATKETLRTGRSEDLPFAEQLRLRLG
jgi:hypothetical protein